MSKNATHNMVYLFDACDQISDFCRQHLLRKMRRKISWTDGKTEGRKDGRMDRRRTVYPSRGYEKGNNSNKMLDRVVFSCQQNGVTTISASVLFFKLIALIVIEKF